MDSGVCAAADSQNKPETDARHLGADKRGRRVSLPKRRDGKTLVAAFSGRGLLIQAVKPVVGAERSGGRAVSNEQTNKNGNDAMNDYRELTRRLDAFDARLNALRDCALTNPALTPNERLAALTTIDRVLVLEDAAERRTSRKARTEARRQ